MQRVLKFVKYLSGPNLSVQVVTVDEKKASYAVFDETLLKDVPAGVTVHRTGSFEPLRILSAILGKDKMPHAGFANAGKGKPGSKWLRFIRGNFFLPDARVGWVRHAYRKAAQLIREQGIDTILVSSPPHSSQLIGLRLKKEFGVKWIADMRDPWTDIYYYKDLMHTARSRKKDQEYEASVLQNADRVVVVSDDIKRILAAKIAKGSDKIHVIPNGFDESDFTSPSLPPPDKFLVTYTGTIAESYNPEIFFKVMKKVREKFPEVKAEVHFVGVLSPSVKQLADRYGLAEITRFTSYVSHEEVIRYMKGSTCLLLVIPEVQNDKGILTGKLFEYLAACKPVIGIGPADGDAAAILNECGAGRMFARGEEAAMEQFVTGLVEKWRSKPDLDLTGATYKKYSRRELAAQLAKLIG